MEFGGPDGGPEGGPEGLGLGGPDGGPEGGPEGLEFEGLDGGPEGGPSDLVSRGVDEDVGSSEGAGVSCSIPPKAPPSKLLSCSCSASSRERSTEVFGFAICSPILSTRRGLNSRCVTGGMKLPAWCRGYHAGLSFLRPGFNSRSGRHLLFFGGHVLLR